MSANLPPLPEPYSASSAIKCATCGASYKPGYSLMPQGNGFPSLIRQTACQGCGGTSFTASIGYDSPSPAKYTAGQMHAYATEALSAQAAELEALRAQRDIAIDMLAHWCEAVDTNGTGWDDWDEHYKDAAYRPTPIRELINAARAALKEQTPNVAIKRRP